MLRYVLSWFGGLQSFLVVFFVFAVIFKLIPGINEFRRQIKSMEDVNQPKPHWFLGHIPQLIPCEEQLYTYFKWIEKFPKCMKLWVGPFMLYFNVHHPDTVKPVLLTDEPKDDFGYRFLRPWIGYGLLTSSGKKWKRNRQMLTRAFHFDILKQYLIVFNSTTEEMMNKWWDREEKDIKVELFNDISLMALDNILQCIMSTKSNCQRLTSKNDYLKSVRVLTEIASKRIFNPLLQIDFLFHLLPIGWRYREALKIAHGYAERVINERRLEFEEESWELEKYISSQSGCQNSGGKTTAKLDFLDILLLSKDDQGVGLSHQEICDEVNTFVFEGHDTVTSSLSWAFYNLSIYPEYQELCRKEVQEVLEGRKNIDWEDLLKFTYLTKFIKESIRMNSPVFDIARTLSKPLFHPRGFGSDQYNTDPDVPPSDDASRTLPKGTKIGVNIFAVHRNPFVWEDPDRFDPERFTLENIEKRSPFAYIPFSSGPRNCIGQHFAMNKLKVVLAKALARFRFTVDDSYPKPEMEPYIILRSKHGIHLKLERI